MQGDPRRWRISPGTAISLIALFVALGGSAAALSGHNSVFSDDIVNHQVKHKDLARVKVHRVKPNPRSVTNDPCDHGRTAIFCGADNDSYARYWRNDDDGVLAPAAFYKDASGLVHLTGFAQSTGPQVPIDFFILPRGYRPAKRLLFEQTCLSGASSDACQVHVNRDGHVEWDIYSDSSSPIFGGMSFDGITFKPR